MKKKLVSIMLVAAMALSVVACGSSKGNSAKTVSYTHLDVYKRQVVSQAAASALHTPTYPKGFVAIRITEMCIRDSYKSAVWRAPRGERGSSGAVYADRTGLCRTCLLYTSRCV